MNAMNATSRRLGVVALAIAALSTMASAHAALRVDLHPTAEVASMRVTLGELATVTGDERDLVERISAVEVGNVAADGSASVVDRAALERWVRVRAGIESHDIAWSGAAGCRVRHAVAATALPVMEGLPVHPGAFAGVHPLVARGGSATLRSVEGPIALESRVEVHDDGAMGQDVHVRLPGATADVVARVTGAGRVEVRQ
jgi:flagella basal body P-ring formation protein FlgA